MNQNLTWIEFFGIVRQRCFQLVIEVISFKVVMFLVICFSARETAQALPYAQSIIDSLAGIGVLAYKAYKEKGN